MLRKLSVKCPFRYKSGPAIEPITKWFQDTGAEGIVLRGDMEDTLYRDPGITQPALVGHEVGGWVDHLGGGYLATQYNSDVKPIRKADTVWFTGSYGDMRMQSPPVFGAGDFSLLLLADLSNTTPVNAVSTSTGGSIGSYPGFRFRPYPDQSVVVILDTGNSETSFSGNVIPGSSGMVLRTIVVDRASGTLTGSLNGVETSVSDVSGLGDFSNPGGDLILGYEGGLKGDIKALVVVNSADIAPLQQALLDLM